MSPQADERALKASFLRYTGACQFVGATHPHRAEIAMWLDGASLTPEHPQRSLELGVDPHLSRARLSHHAAVEFGREGSLDFLQAQGCEQEVIDRYNASGAHLAPASVANWVGIDDHALDFGWSFGGAFSLERSCAWAPMGAVNNELRHWAAGAGLNQVSAIAFSGQEDKATLRLPLSDLEQLRGACEHFGCSLPEVLGELIPPEQALSLSVSFSARDLLELSLVAHAPSLELMVLATSLVAEASQETLALLQGTLDVSTPCRLCWSLKSSQAPSMSLMMSYRQLF